MIVYAVGAIDLGKDIEGWRQKLISICNFPVTVFDPSTAYKATKTELTADQCQYIENVNYAALKAADVVVALISKSVPSIGSPIELEYARELAKPIILITDIPYAKSVYLTNRVAKEDWIYCEELTGLELGQAFMNAHDRLYSRYQSAVKCQDIMKADK